MNFEELFNRNSNIEAYMPYDASRYLGLVEQGSFGEKAYEHITKVFQPSDMLLDRHFREVLFGALHKDEALNLLKRLGKRQGQSTVWERLKQIYKSPEKDAVVTLFEFLEVDTEPCLKYFKIEEETAQENAREAIQYLAPKGQLFPHQRRALLELEELFFNPNHPCYSALLHMPTGSGKTRTASMIASRYLLRYDQGLVVWLADTKELCDQAYDELAQSWALHGDRTLPIYRAYGSVKPNWSEVTHGILVLSLQTANSVGEDVILGLGSRAPLVIFDEAHKTAADTYEMTVKNLQPPPHGTSSRLLGLTATPGRSVADEAANAKLAEIFGRKRITLKIPGFDNPVSYLMSEGYLAKPNFVKLTSDFDFKACCDHLGIRIPNDGRGLSGRALERINKILADDDSRNALVFQEAVRLLTDGNHKRMIIFAASVEQANRLAFMLKYHGFNARCVDSNSSAVDRVQAIEDFKVSVENDPTPKVLCNYNILTAGFDAPQTSVVMIARATTSLVLYSQMVGRALRGPKAGGNAESTVVTVVDQNIPAFWDVEDAFRHWNSYWND